MGGKIDKVKGHAKEAVGEVTENEDLKKEGRRDRAAGSIKEGAQKIKDAVERGVDRARDALRGDKNARP